MSAAASCGDRPELPGPVEIGNGRRFCLESVIMSTSDRSSTLSYSTIELQSYLPPGWNLETDQGTYEPKRQRWQIAIQDGSELVSTLIVDQKEADRLGRIAALRAAIDRLERRV